ncbi:hypothetical protein D3C84_358620 [compost metagenome]
MQLDQVDIFRAETGQLVGACRQAPGSGAAQHVERTERLLVGVAIATAQAGQAGDIGTQPVALGERRRAQDQGGGTACRGTQVRGQPAIDLIQLVEQGIGVEAGLASGPQHNLFEGGLRDPQAGEQMAALGGEQFGRMLASLQLFEGSMVFRRELLRFARAFAQIEEGPAGNAGRHGFATDHQHALALAREQALARQVKGAMPGDAAVADIDQAHPGQPERRHQALADARTGVHAGEEGLVDQIEIEVRVGQGQVHRRLGQFSGIATAQCGERGHANTCDQYLVRHRLGPEVDSATWQQASRRAVSRLAGGSSWDRDYCRRATLTPPAMGGAVRAQGEGQSQARAAECPADRRDRAHACGCRPGTCRTGSSCAISRFLRRPPGPGRSACSTGCARAIAGPRAPWG